MEFKGHCSVCRTHFYHKSKMNSLIMSRFLQFVNIQLQCSDSVCVACVHDQHSVMFLSTVAAKGSDTLLVPALCRVVLLSCVVFFFYSKSEARGHPEEFSLCCRKKKALESRTYCMYILMVLTNICQACEIFTVR